MNKFWKFGYLKLYEFWFYFSQSFCVCRQSSRVVICLSSDVNHFTVNLTLTFCIFTYIKYLTSANTKKNNSFASFKVYFIKACASWLTRFLFSSACGLPQQAKVCCLFPKKRKIFPPKTSPGIDCHFSSSLSRTKQQLITVLLRPRLHLKNIYVFFKLI